MATEDVFVRDITIPKGMQINCLVFAMHRDPEYWPEPEVFKPERLVALDPYPVKIVSSSHSKIISQEVCYDSCKFERRGFTANAITYP